MWNETDNTSDFIRPFTRLFRLISKMGFAPETYNSSRMSVF